MAHSKDKNDDPNDLTNVEKDESHDQTQSHEQSIDEDRLIMHAKQATLNNRKKRCKTRENAKTVKIGKEIDVELVTRLSMIHCTIEEIAMIVGCTKMHLFNHYADVIELGRAKGKMSLRRLQWRAAETGNVSMLVWLGKNILNQTDKVHEVIIDHTTAKVPGFKFLEPEDKKVPLSEIIEVE